MSGTSAVVDNEDDIRRALQVTVGLLVVFVVVVAVYYATKPRRPRGQVSDGLERNGWILYTRPGCGFCDQQKNLLGQKFLNDAGNVVDCDPKKTERHSERPGKGIPHCGDGRIVGYPFWFNRKTGGIKIGLQDAAQLRSMAAPRST